MAFAAVMREEHEQFVGRDVSELVVDKQPLEKKDWLTGTPGGIAVLVLMTIVLSPVLIVFGAFYGAFKPFQH